MKRVEDAVGITNADAEYVDKWGMWLRPKTLDESIAREARTYLKHMPPTPQDTLLDVGGNIGCVSKAYLDAGCAFAISVEPEPDNVELLQRNLAPYGPRATVIDRAVVGDGAPATTELLISVGGNRGAHTTQQRATKTKRPTVEVRTAPLSQLVAYYKPTLLKVDVEGAEYDFADELGRMPATVRAIMIELHLHRPNRHVRAKGIALDQIIRDSGFELSWESGPLETAWFSLRTYLRVR